LAFEELQMCLEIVCHNWDIFALYSFSMCQAEIR